MSVAKHNTVATDNPEIVILVELFASGIEDDIPEYGQMKFTKADLVKWQSLAASAAQLKVDAIHLGHQDCTFYRAVDTVGECGALEVHGRSNSAVLVLTSAGFGWTSNLAQFPQSDSWCTSIFTFDELDLLVEKTAELLSEEGAVA